MLGLDDRDFRLTAGPGFAIAAPFALPLAYLAAARGPGRPCPRRCRQGVLARPAGDRFCRTGGRAGLMPEDAGIRQPGFQAPPGPGLSLAAPLATRRSPLAFRPTACLPGRRPWAWASRPAAKSSGQAGLAGRRSYLRAGGRAGLMPGVAGIRQPGFQANGRPQQDHRPCRR